MTPRRSILCLLVALPLGCGDGAASTDAAIALDAAPTPADASATSDGIPPLLWVDFAISGCPTGGAEVTPDAGVTEPCTGTAPLTVSFTPISPTPVDVYLWSFGDYTDSDQATPSHVYPNPGSYDVTLVVGGAGGTASKTKAGVVVVEPAGLGARCTSATQCAESLHCVCPAGSECPAELNPGVCTAGCTEQSCPDGVCADLAPGDPAEPAEWQAALCLVACTGDQDCPGDLSCRELHDGNDAGWLRGCFASGLLGPIGASCRDGSGALDDTRCASGSCWGQGARGMCSESCTAGSCPPSAACATFTGTELGARCVARCAEESDCTADPWLACQPPGGPGDQGFTVDETAAPLGYCAPKSCTEPTECGDGGTCTDGYCGPA